MESALFGSIYRMLKREKSVFIHSIVLLIKTQIPLSISAEDWILIVIFMNAKIINFSAVTD